MTSFTSAYPAPGKLNLFLHITGRRPDGYHLLQTVFRLIDYADSLSFRVREDGLIKMERPTSGVAPERDLCLRAARLLHREGGCSLGAEICVEKKLPLGGGLGGGSSDAATTLLALNRLWRLNLKRERLMELGLQLGADVPLFVFGESAFAEGIGEKLEAVSLPPCWYLVLVPPVGVSTREVYASSQLTRNTNPIKISAFSIEQGHNDLEPVVCANYPVIEAHLSWLRQFGRAAMTGAGSCVFSAFSQENAAQQALAELPAGMQGFVARGLDRHPLRELTE